MREPEELVAAEDLPTWCAAKAFCPACRKTTTMVYPVEMLRWECECGHWNPAPTLPHEPAGKDLPR